MVISEEVAEDLLREDLDWVEKAIDKWVKVDLTQNQYDALASLVFNIGEGNFAKSSVLRWTNSKNFVAAADSFLLWNKQRNKTTGKLEVLNGLTTRRRKEKELFLK
jgi:lysozyme